MIFGWYDFCLCFTTPGTEDLLFSGFCAGCFFYGSLSGMFIFCRGKISFRQRSVAGCNRQCFCCVAGLCLRIIRIIGGTAPVFFSIISGKIRILKRVSSVLCGTISGKKPDSVSRRICHIHQIISKAARMDQVPHMIAACFGNAGRHFSGYDITDHMFVRKCSFVAKILECFRKTFAYYFCIRISIEYIDQLPGVDISQIIVSLQDVLVVFSQVPDCPAVMEQLSIVRFVFRRFNHVMGVFHRYGYGA